MKSSLGASFIWAFFLANLALIEGCYDLPKVQEQGGAGGTSSSESSATASVSSGSGGQGGISVGGAGGGPQGDCNAGESMLCTAYSGPTETKNVGPCKGSVSTCTQSGSWGPCLPEILPTVETCQSVDDTNCDGILPCSGLVAGVFPGMGAGQTPLQDTISAVAIAPGSKGSDGNVYAVGARNAATLSPPNEQRILVWNRTPNGLLQDWSNLFSFTAMVPTNNATATAVGVLPGSNDVVVAGVAYGGSLTIDGLTATSTPPLSFITNISPSGTITRLSFLNTGDSLEVRDLAIDSAGNIYLAGTYSGAPSVNAFVFPTATDADGFVLRMKPDHSIDWVQHFSGPGIKEVASLAMTANNDVAIAVEFTGTMMVNTTSGMKAFDAGVDNDVLIGRLAGNNGAALWTTAIASSGMPAKIAIGDIAANDQFVVAGGRFRGSMALGANVYSVVDSNDQGDAFVAKFDSMNGTISSHYASQSVGIQTLHAIALDSTGDLVLVGSYTDALPFPGKAINTSNAMDAFVFKLDKNLNAIWGQRFGDGSSQISETVAIGDVTGQIYVGGGFQSSIPEVNPPLMSTGGFDAFLLKLGD